jgi:hypothetical protein
VAESESAEEEYVSTTGEGGACERARRLGPRAYGGSPTAASAPLGRDRPSRSNSTRRPRLTVLLSCTVLYCTILYYTVLYCTILYYTVLYCTILYYTVLYYCPVLSCPLRASLRSRPDGVVSCTKQLCPGRVRSAPVWQPSQLGKVSNILPSPPPSSARPLLVDPTYIFHRYRPSIRSVPGYPTSAPTLDTPRPPNGTRGVHPPPRLDAALLQRRSSPESRSVGESRIHSRQQLRLVSPREWKASLAHAEESRNDHCNCVAFVGTPRG